MVASRNSQHIRDKFGRDRRARLVFLVHTCIGKTRNNGSDTTCRGGLAGRDEDEEFHQVIVHVTTPRLDNEHVFFADGLGYFDVDLAIGELLRCAWSEEYSKPVGG